MRITIDEIAQVETGLIEIEKEIIEARFHEVKNGRVEG